MGTDKKYNEKYISRKEAIKKMGKCIYNWCDRTAQACSAPPCGNGYNGLMATVLGGTVK